MICSSFQFRIQFWMFAWAQLIEQTSVTNVEVAKCYLASPTLFVSDDNHAFTYMMCHGSVQSSSYISNHSTKWFSVRFDGMKCRMHTNPTQVKQIKTQSKIGFGAQYSYTDVQTDDQSLRSTIPAITLISMYELKKNTMRRWADTYTRKKNVEFRHISFGNSCPETFPRSRRAIGKCFTGQEMLKGCDM